MLPHLQKKDIYLKSLDPLEYTLFGKMIFAIVIKLRVLQMWNNPGLSGWALNATAYVLIKET